MGQFWIRGIRALRLKLEAFVALVNYKAKRLNRLLIVANIHKSYTSVLKMFETNFSYSKRCSRAFLLVSENTL